MLSLSHTQRNREMVITFTCKYSSLYYSKGKGSLSYRPQLIQYHHITYTYIISYTNRCLSEKGKGSPPNPFHYTGHPKLCNQQIHRIIDHHNRIQASCGCQLLVAASFLWPPASCGRQLLVAASFLWLPASCGRQLLMVASFLWLPASYGCQLLMAASLLWPPASYGRQLLMVASFLWLPASYGCQLLMAASFLLLPASYCCQLLMAASFLWLQENQKTKEETKNRASVLLKR